MATHAKLSVCLGEASPVPKNYANRNITYKTNENMQISAIKSIENISQNAIHIA